MVHTELVESIKDRLKHPFLGTLLSSFFIYNWKAVLTATTGDLKPSERINEILSVTIINEQTPNYNFFYYPLIWTFIFTLLYPIFTAILKLGYHFVAVYEKNLSDWITRRHESTNKNRNQEIQNLVIQIRRQHGAWYSRVQNGFSNSEASQLIDEIKGIIQTTQDDLEAISTNNHNAIKFRIKSE